MSTPRKRRTLEVSAGELLPSLKSTHTSFTVIPAASRLFSNHLRKLYSDFDGDLVMALVFSEVAMRNMSRVLPLLAAQRRRPAMPLEAILKQVEKEMVMPCNALSIAEATGIPRETARQKIAKLEKKGWVMRPKHNMVLITAKSVERLRGRAEEMVVELLASAQEVRQMRDREESAQ